MKFQEYEDIVKKYNKWHSLYKENDRRGKKFIDFAILGNQWDPGVESKRKRQNKESLTFNLCIKYVKRVKSQSRDIEFSIDICPINKEVQENVDETNIFRLLLSSIVLNKEITKSLDDTLDKCVDFGYSFVEVNYDFIDFDTLCEVPVVISHKDPTIAFWDKFCRHPNKIDGAYCGMLKKVTREEVLLKYPHLEKDKNLDERNNTFLDYWYREYKDEEFCLLKSGVYKKKSSLNIDDQNNLADEKYIKKMRKKYPDQEWEILKTHETCCIYYKRYMNNILVVKDMQFPTDDLPLIYHDGLTNWHAEKGDFTTPLVYHLEGAQKLHNYVNSQIATQVKNITADKWIMSDEHVSSPEHQENARKINQYEGAMVLGGNTQSINHVAPSQISESLINYSQVLKNEIDEISGSAINTKNAQQTVISGEALDKITKSMDLINADVIAKHINFVNTVGKIIRQMLPKIITEERIIVVKKQDGSGEVLTVNKDTGNGTILNNIKDVNDNFMYEITAGPSAAMQKENTIKYLIQIYSMNPKLFDITGDIFMRSLDSVDAGELERRVSSQMDDGLIKYSQGAITKEKYNEMAQQNSMRNMQQQVQMSQFDPQVQSAKALAAAEDKKAKAEQYNAETKRIDVVNKASQNIMKLKIELGRLMVDENDAHASKQIQFIQSQLDVNQHILDAYKDIVQDQQLENQNKQKSEQDKETMAGQMPQGEDTQRQSQSNNLSSLFGGDNAAAA